MLDNRRAKLIGACSQAVAWLVAADKCGDESSPDYTLDAVARTTRMIADELLHDATVTSVEYRAHEK